MQSGFILIASAFVVTGCTGPCEDTLSPDFDQISGTMSFTSGGDPVESRTVELTETGSETCTVNPTYTPTSGAETSFTVSCPDANGAPSGFTVYLKASNLLFGGTGERELDTRSGRAWFRHLPAPGAPSCFAFWPADQPPRLVIDVARGSSGANREVSDDLRREGRFLLSVRDGDYAGSTSSYGPTDPPCTLHAGFSAEIAFVQIAENYRRTVETHCD